MNTYDIRYQNEDGEFHTHRMLAADSGRAIVAWRRLHPMAKLVWMKRKDDDLTIVPDRRLPSEPD